MTRQPIDRLRAALDHTPTGEIVIVPRDELIDLLYTHDTGEARIKRVHTSLVQAVAERDEARATKNMHKERAQAAIADLDLAKAQIGAVLELHWSWGDTLTSAALCDACQHPWPCATVRALDGER